MLHLSTFTYDVARIHMVEREREAAAFRFAQLARRGRAVRRG